MSLEASPGYWRAKRELALAGLGSAEPEAWALAAFAAGLPGFASPAAPGAGLPEDLAWSCARLWLWSGEARASEALCRHAESLLSRARPGLAKLAGASARSGQDFACGFLKALAAGGGRAMALAEARACESENGCGWALWTLFAYGQGAEMLPKAAQAAGVWAAEAGGSKARLGWLASWAERGAPDPLEARACQDSCRALMEGLPEESLAEVAIRAAKRGNWELVGAMAREREALWDAEGRCGLTPAQWCAQLCKGLQGEPAASCRAQALAAMARRERGALALACKSRAAGKPQRARAL